VALASACSSGPRVTSRALVLHAPAACAPGPSPYALFYPFGDFQPETAAASLPLADVGAALDGVPADTREVVVSVTDASDGQWVAHALVAPSGDVDLLVLPYRAPCTLTGSLDARADPLFAAIDAAHVLVAGGTSAGAAVPTTAVVDLSRGSLAPLRAGLLVPRDQASATPWSGGAVVAGGVRPDTGEAVASAEFYSSDLGDFDGAPIPLSEARARHGAALLVSGNVLLVGGVDASGSVLGSLEIVDPVARRARTGGLAAALKRADPAVMRLASGEILVAGGVDAAGAPVTTLEWFLPDGTAPSRTARDLVASARRAFVPLPAGGALAVVAPDAPTPGFQNVWVVSADGALEAAAPIEGTLTDVRLVAGTEGAPILWTGDRWLIWQPWLGAFAALGEAIGAQGPSGDPVAAPEPGFGVWLDGTSVRTLRFGARGPYAAASPASPLLATQTSFTAPDRLVLPGAAGATLPIAFDPAAGLSLQPGASVFVTDATYASFTLDAQTPGATPPAIVLRDAAGNETVLDATACPAGAAGAIHLERSGGSVRVSAGGGPLTPCAAGPAASARVSIGVRGQGTGTTVLRALVITRT